MKNYLFYLLKYWSNKFGIFFNSNFIKRYKKSAYIFLKPSKSKNKEILLKKEKLWSYMLHIFLGEILTKLFSFLFESNLIWSNLTLSEHEIKSEVSLNPTNWNILIKGSGRLQMLRPAELHSIVMARDDQTQQLRLPELSK